MRESVKSMRSTAKSIGCLWIATLAILAGSAWQSTAGQEFDEQYEHWPEQLKINGKLILGGGLDNAALLMELLRLAEDDELTVLVDDAVEDDYLKSLQLGDRAVRLPLDRGDALGSVRRALQPKDAADEAGPALVIVQKGEFSADELAAWEKQRGAVQTELRQHLARGGVLVCDHQACRWIGSATVNIEQGPTFSGVAAIPDTLVAPQYEAGRRQQLLRALKANPGTVGIGIPATAAIMLNGRKIQMAGEGETTFLIAANEREPAHQQSIVAPRRRLPPEAWLADWTQWRRRAMDRTLPPFPPSAPPTPHVPHGTLVIVGGGGTPRGLMERIVELAGGKRRARMVYIPCSESEEVGERQRTVEMWRKMGVKHATFIHTKDRRKANEDASFYEPLKNATGLWFGGGRQWNFADSYYGTTTHKLMKDVLRRGGVISGSSAGASVQARFLARATPIRNVRILAPGYERGGLGFIGGVAIDQHFSQRGRQKDMTQLVNRYPQLLGVGLDESTAILVAKSRAEVVGKGRVFFYNRRLPVVEGKPDYVALGAGSVYDLAQRAVLLDAQHPLPPLETVP